APQHPHRAVGSNPCAAPSGGVFCAPLSAGFLPISLLQFSPAQRPPRACRRDRAAPCRAGPARPQSLVINEMAEAPQGRVKPVAAEVKGASRVEAEAPHVSPLRLS